MEVSSVQHLCRHLISSAIQRCRMADDPCRLSVMVKFSSLADPSLICISVSDTGVGSCLMEFKDLRYTVDPVSAEKWDGMIYVSTTSTSDIEIHQYNFNLKETVSRRPEKLPSNMKNGVKFSGTEVSVLTTESVEDLLAEFIFFLQKVFILKIPKIEIELVLDFCGIPRPQYENHIILHECNTPLSPTSSIQCLKSGLEDYVLKHGNKLSSTCHSCFLNGESLKVGSGVASCKVRRGSTELVMEAIIIISETPKPTTQFCLRSSGTKTEALYFKDFSPSIISQSCLEALRSINWKTCGLTLRNIVDQEGIALLEWEALPPSAHIDVILHIYCKKAMIPALKLKSQSERTLTRKAVNLALNDLKEKHGRILPSAHALKIQSYAPELAKTTAGLVMSSNDMEFKRECSSLLGLQFEETEANIVVDQIREKIISAMDLVFRKPKRRRENAVLLFKDNYNTKEAEALDEEKREAEESSYMIELYSPSSSTTGSGL